MAPITTVTVFAAEPPRSSVRFTELLPAVRTTVTIVEIRDEAGAVGVGAIESDSFGAPDLGPLESLRSVAPALLGRDSGRPAAIGELVRSLVPSASRSVPCAALEIASWDLLARGAGLPLYQILGGARDEVPAYASLPFERDRSAQFELVDRAREAGFRAMKLHVSGDAAADAARVEDARSTYPDMDIMVDAEGAYDRRSAAAVGGVLNGLDIRWFEAPLPDRDVDGYRALTRMLEVPVIPAGGVIDDLREYAQILRRAPWSAVRSQSMEGGIRYIVELAGLARAFGLDLELTSYGTSLIQATDLHLMLGLGIGHYYEQPFPMEPWNFGTTAPVPLDRGVAHAPDGPGLGMELDRDAIAAAQVGTFVVGR